jgi:hypothetical protein
MPYSKFKTFLRKVAKNVPTISGMQATSGTLSDFPPGLSTKVALDAATFFAVAARRSSAA